MRLNDFAKALQSCPRIGDGKAIRARVGRIFYVVRGRNAWHSTWVQHYQPGCMSTDLLSAERSAEEWRSRGSGFKVLDQPTLVIESDDGSLVITQINATNQLEGYTAIGAREFYDYRTRDFKKTRFARRLKYGSSIKETSESFHIDSPYWSKKPEPKATVHQLWLPHTHHVITLKKDDKLFVRRSVPSGDRLCPMTWVQEIRDKVETSYLNYLVSVFEDGPSKALSPIE